VIALELLVFFGLGLAALFALGRWVGYLLPREWRAYAVVLAPLVGYVVLLLVGYYAVWTVLNLAAGLALALLLALVLTLLLHGLARRRAEEPAGTPDPGPVHPVRGWMERQGVWEHGPALLLALAAAVVAVLPLFSYGYSVPSGENWDPENYMPITAYLQQVPVSRMIEMPPNPLRDLNAAPPHIGMTLGFCVLQGALGVLPGVGDALRTFAPTVALLYGLTALAWYALLRLGFGLGRWAGTIAAAFAGLSALTLWTAFFNFGMQMAAMPLVPLALTLWLLALRHTSWRTALLGGLAVAALPVAYYPALTVFVPVAVGLGLYEVARARSTARDAAAARPQARLQAIAVAVAAGLATAGLAVVLAIGPIIDYGHGFSSRYNQQTTTLGLFSFPTLAQLLGLAPFSRTPEALPALWAGLAAALPWLVIAGAAGVLVARRPRWIWAAVFLPVLLYLAWLRGWFLPLAEALRLPTGLVERFRPYHYAFLKGAVFVVPFFWGAAVDTAARLAAWRREQRPAGRAWRAVLGGVLVLFLGLVVAADARLVARYWGRPAHFDAAAMQVEKAVELIPPGAEVYLTGRPDRSRVILGLYSYFLLDHPVQGRLSTAYGGYDRRLAGREPGYALLDADDNPLPLGFCSADAIWTGGGMVLYRRSPDIVSFLDLRATAYTGLEPGAVHTKEPLAERVQNEFGAQRMLLAGESMTLYVDAVQVSTREDLAGAAGTGALLLSFAAFEPATVTLRWADGTSEECALPAGPSTCRSGPHPLPGRVAIVASPDYVPIWPCWAALVEAGARPGVQGQPQQALLFPSTTTADSTVQVALRWYSDNSRPLRLALEVWEDSFSSANHYAWWGPAWLPDQGTLYLQADLAARRAQLELADPLHLIPVELAAHPGADGWPTVVDGAYFVALWVYYGEQVVEVVPLGRFAVSGGQVQGLEPLEPGVRLVRPHSPAEASGARFGASIELAAYELADRTFSPGDGVPLALEWHALASVPAAYAVSVQLLKDGRLEGQWDGPAGQWYGTTAWRPGQWIRDDIPLRIPTGAPAGRYRLIAAVYDPATATRLPVRSAEGVEVGDFLDLGEIVVR